MLALLASSPVLVTKTFTANGTLAIPANVVSVNLSGFGARGSDASEVLIDAYTTTITTTLTRRDGGPSEYTVVDGGLSYGNPRSDYCDPPRALASPTYSTARDCYAFSDASYYESQPATTGASATAIGKSFPGSTGNTAPAITTFNNVAVTPGGSYNVVVPAGGSITISYYQ